MGEGAVGYVAGSCPRHFSASIASIVAAAGYLRCSRGIRISRCIARKAETGAGAFTGFGRWEEQGAACTGCRFEKVSDMPQFCNAVGKEGHTTGVHRLRWRKVSGRGIRCRLGVCMDGLAVNMNPALATSGGSVWYYEDFSGSLCTRLQGTKASKTELGLPLLTETGSELTIILDCGARTVAFEMPTGESREIAELPTGPFYFFVSIEDKNDAWEVMPDDYWRYQYSAPFEIRSSPDMSGPRTGYQLQPGDVFLVSMERRSGDGILYLQLADGRGWVCESKPDFPTLCVRQCVQEGMDEIGKELTEDSNLLTKIKRLGPAGIAAYGITEGGFWMISVPAVALSYRVASGEWPDVSSQEDLAKVFGTSFAFLNIARLAVPLRIGLAIGLAPWVDTNVIKPFFPHQWEAWRLQCEENPEECQIPEPAP